MFSDTVFEHHEFKVNEQLVFIGVPFFPQSVIGCSLPSGVSLNNHKRYDVEKHDNGSCCLLISESEP